MTQHAANLYDDGVVICGSDAVTIRWYYLWGAKTIPYTMIKSVAVLPLTGANAVRRWRIWGSGDFIHWWNLDPHRPRKDTALVLDVGRLVRPTITPEDATTVQRILTRHLAA